MVANREGKCDILTLGTAYISTAVIDTQIYADSALIEANGSNAVTITNVAPAGVGTATISKWLKIVLSDGTYYIPLWT